jgi:hypothetical protein
MRIGTLGVCAAVAAAVVTGCNKNPSEPSDNATVTALAIFLDDVVLAGLTSTATATATLSNGQTRQVTTGFRTDNPAVATVTDAGAVSGVANGEVTITVASDGREASKRIRVAPNYGGAWSGLQTVTSCVATLDFEGVCEVEGGVVGEQFPIALTGRQPANGLSVSGEFAIEGIGFPTFTAAVETDGTLRFSSTLLEDGFRGEGAWVINATQVGRAAGTIREVYSVPGELDGEVTYESTLADFTRGGAAAGPLRRVVAQMTRMRLIRSWRR